MRAAVIGCGRMGAFPSDKVRRFAPRCWFPLSHAEAIRRHPSLELIALCDSNPQSLERAAAQYGVGRSFADHQRMLEEARPELVGIATRTPGRAAIVRDAAAGGVRALHIEKPLCNSVAELEALAGTLAHAELFCSYGAIRRYFSVYQTALALARSGSYGSLREVRVNMGSGALYWTHPHSVDLILFAAGEGKVEAVQARLGNLTRGAAAVEIASDPLVESAAIYFADGLAGYITQGQGCDLVLSCSAGEVTVESDGRGIRIAAPRGDDPYPQRTAYDCLSEVAKEEGTLAPIAHLVGCLGGDPAEVRRNGRHKAQMLEGQRILFAMVQSHLEGSRLVTLADIDPGIIVHAKTGEHFA